MTVVLARERLHGVNREGKGGSSGPYSWAPGAISKTSNCTGHSENQDDALILAVREPRRGFEWISVGQGAMKPAAGRLQPAESKE